MIGVRLPFARLATAALIALGGGLALAPAPAEAQTLSPSAQRALAKACRDDYRRLCKDVRPGGGAIIQCLREHDSELSPDCRAASAPSTQTAALRKSPDGATRSRILRDVTYGPNRAQRMDVYLPAEAARAPVIVMVHGGAWSRGSKSAGAVVTNKVEHWTAKGFVFVSVDYRLLPEADPVEQARDVGRALAETQRQAESWGASPNRIVLMGHSSGAHLVALLAADASLVRDAGAAPALGIVALDSAAYDVAKIMGARHARLYDRVFGKDPEYWRAASPTLVLAGAPPPMLLVCSKLRAKACDQAEALAEKARGFGGEARVLSVGLSHRQINAHLGLAGLYTDAVDGFLHDALGGR